MGSFEGFSSKSIPVHIPDNFFTEILPGINNLHILKIILFAIVEISGSEDPVNYFDPKAFLQRYFADQKQEFLQALNIAIASNLLLSIEVNDTSGAARQICFLNTPKSIAAIEAIQSGQLQIVTEEALNINRPPRPDIFRLYEENIGPLTPIIADNLKDLEASYSPEWINKAIQVAVKNNARSLRYIEVVLKNWQEEGYDDRTNRRRSQKTDEKFDPKRYTDGEFSDFFDN